MTPPRTTGVDGLPLYRHGEIPAELATATMLRERRLRLAQGQEHVAWYLRIGAHARGDHPLYRIADAVPMAPLRGKAAEAYTAARTCARCGVTGIHRLPWRSDGTHGRRLLDHACHRAELASLSRAEWMRDRFAAVTWAAGVLVDEQVVLIDARTPSGTLSVRIHAATIGGEILLDGVSDLGGRPIRTRLPDRRLIAWDPWWSLGTDDGDRLGVRLTHWLMRPGEHGGREQQRHPAGADPRDVVQTMREHLVLMAADRHPDGPPGTCPVLPETGLTPCGAELTTSGVCEVHRRPLLLAALAGGR